jgi:membrane protein DedA with SNARE-associated domain
MPDLTTLLAPLLGALSYPAIALLMLFVAPELVLPYAGVLVAQGKLEPHWVVLVASVSALFPQLVFYGLARRCGEARVRG